MSTTTTTLTTENSLLIVLGNEESPRITFVASNVCTYHRMPASSPRLCHSVTAVTPSQTRTMHMTTEKGYTHLIGGHRVYGKENPARFEYGGRGSVILVWRFPGEEPTLFYIATQSKDVHVYLVPSAISSNLLRDPTLRIPSHQELQSRELPLVFPEASTSSHWHGELDEEETAAASSPDKEWEQEDDPMGLMAVNLDRMSSSFGVRANASIMDQHPSEGSFLLIQHPNDEWSLQWKNSHGCIPAFMFVHPESHRIRFVFGASVFYLVIYDTGLQHCRAYHEVSPRSDHLLFYDTNTEITPKKFAKLRKAYGDHVTRLTKRQLQLSYLCEIGVYGKDDEEDKEEDTVILETIGEDGKKVRRKHTIKSVFSFTVYTKREKIVPKRRVAFQADVIKEMFC